MSFLDDLRAELLPFEPKRVALTPQQRETLDSLFKDGDTIDTFDGISPRYSSIEAIPIIQLLYGVNFDQAVLYRAIKFLSVHQLQRLKQLLKNGDTPESFQIDDERYSYYEALEITHLLEGGLIDQAEETVRYIRGIRPLGLQFEGDVNLYDDYS